MNFPEEVLAVIREADQQNPSSAQDAIEQARAGIKQLDNYADLVETLVNQAVADLVYQTRHIRNVQTLNQARAYHSAPKNKPAADGAVAGVYRSYFQYAIAGTALGQIMGKDLPGIAADQRGKASGYLFNARLCETLRPLVRDDQTVKDALTERKLKKLFEDLGGPEFETPELEAGH